MVVKGDPHIAGPSPVKTMLLAALLAPPTVHVVEIDADASMRPWLVARLLEEGFAVAPAPEAANVRLHVAQAGTQWSVEARGMDAQRHLVPAGEAAIARLEILHRAVAALEDVRPLEPSDPRPTVAANVAPAVDPAVREELSTRLADRMLAAGVTVVPSSAPRQRSVCVAPRDDGLAVWVVSDAAACSESPPPEAQPVAVDQAPDLAATLALAAGAEPEPEPEPEPEDPEPPAGIQPPEPPEETEQPPRQRRPVAIRAAARGGIIGRVRPFDYAFGGSLAIGLKKGPSGWLDLQMWTNGQPSIFEAVPAAGLRWRFQPLPRLAIDTGALVGLQIHRYSLFGETGVRYDWSLEAMGGLWVAVYKGLEIGLDFRLGRSGRPRSHVRNGVVVWERGATRVGGGLSVAYRWTVNP